MIKILLVTPISVTVEIENSDIYYSSIVFDAYLNGEKVKNHIKTNVFSLYDLKPGTNYFLSVNGEEIHFKTKDINSVITVNNIDNSSKKDVTKDIQSFIDKSHSGDLIIIEEGKYLITSLFMKSDITLYLKKGCLLTASINEDDYIEIDGEENKDGEIIQRGSWEGDPHIMKASFINFIDVNNSSIIGEGAIDGNAQLSNWWIGFREKRYARPHMIFMNQSKNCNVEGISLFNSPQWTVHPYFSNNVSFYNIFIKNPKISPNTDGIDPECCKSVNIVGVHFSVGDDCIAIKSGKIYIGKKYKKPCEGIVISNCLMEFGHGAVVLGSEMSGGIKDLTVEKCIFNKTDRGLRIKTRRGRGKDAIIDNVCFKNIKMIDVLAPLTINMFYFCDPDGKTEYVYSKEKLPVDDRTPYLGSFEFTNINSINSQYALGYFYGLPEEKIKKIVIKDSSFTIAKNSGEGNPLMMTNAEKCSKRGFIFKNVDKVVIKNVSVDGLCGPLYETSDVGELINE